MGSLMTETVSDHAGTVSAHAESQNDLAIPAQRAVNRRNQTREAMGDQGVDQRTGPVAGGGMNDETSGSRRAKSPSHDPKSLT
jgi:hypothetical protein